MTKKSEQADRHAEKAREIVAKFRGKFINWENAEPLVAEIAQAIRESEQRGGEKPWPTIGEFETWAYSEFGDAAEVDAAMKVHDYLTQHAAPKAAVSDEDIILRPKFFASLEKFQIESMNNIRTDQLSKGCF